MTHYPDGDHPKPQPTPTSAHVIAITTAAILIGAYVALIGSIT